MIVNECLILLHVETLIDTKRWDNRIRLAKKWDTRIRLAKKGDEWDSRIRLAKKWDNRIRLAKKLMSDWDKRIRLAKKSDWDNRIRLAKKDMGTLPHYFIPYFISNLFDKFQRTMRIIWTKSLCWKINAVVFD